ncbi:hypothetical protein EON65_20860 [archaeon]|nr:MAG: hypothetical protein EON65_20860 [archaeon]
MACIDLPKPEGIKSCVTSYVKHEKFTRENNEILSSRTRHKKGTNGVSVSFKPPIKKTIEEVSNIESSERPKRKAAIVAATEVSRTLTLFERPKHASPPMAKHTTGKVHLTTVPSHKQQTPGKIVMPVFPSHKQPAAGKIAETISPNQKLRVYDHSKSSIQPSPTTKSAPPVSSLKKGSQSDVASSNPASSARRGIRKRLRSEENGAVAPPSVLPVLSDAPSEIDLEMQCLRSMVKTVADDFRCLVLAVKTHFPFCWTHRLRIMEGILMVCVCIASSRLDPCFSLCTYYFIR